MTEFLLSCNILNVILKKKLYRLTLFICPDIIFRGCYSTQWRTSCYIVYMTWHNDAGMHVAFEVVLQFHLNKTLNELYL